MSRNHGNRRRPARWAVLALGLGTLAGPALAQDAGFGDKIPLGIALKQIVPDTYKVDVAPGVDEQAPVSWSGGGWKKALAGAAKGAGYAVVVTADTVKVVKSGSGKVETAERSGAEQADASRVAPRAERFERPARAERHERHVRRRLAEEAPPRRHRERRVHVAEASAETVSGGGFVMLPVRSAEPVVSKDGPGRWREPLPGRAAPVPGPSGWVVRQGDNLQAVLRDWAAREGWTLVWNSEFSYSLTSSARFEGDFVKASGELLRSMRAARPLVTASFFQGNKTLVVGNDNADGAGQ